MCSTTSMKNYFYPRPPRGGRLSASTSGAAALNFYPRPPRGGRPVDSGRVFGGTHFYPRPPRGGRRLPPSGQRLLQETHFYPRPPRGGRRKAIPCWQSRSRFLSTPSARRATRREVALNVRKKISIHALREEGDNNFINHCTAPFNFYPRPPRGGRHRSWHR